MTSSAGAGHCLRRWARWLVSLAAVSFILPSSIAAASEVSALQGLSPFDLAITHDGSYAFTTYDNPPTVLRIRLSDFAIVGVLDLSSLGRMECTHVVLDATETKLFVQARTWDKLLVIDTASMTLTHTFDNWPLIGMIRSQVGTRILTWDGGGWVRVLDTETLTATTQETLNDLFISQLAEVPGQPSKWYLLARSQPGAAAPLTMGVFDHAARSWDDSTTFSTQQTVEVVNAMAVFGAEAKAYISTFGGWVPAGSGYGWLYTVDLARHQTTTIPIDGGAFPLALRPDLHRLYVGTGWPSPNDKNLLVLDTSTGAVTGSISLGQQMYGWPHTQVNVLRFDPSDQNALYVTPGDSNSLVKVRLDSQTVERARVFNHEDVPAQAFAKRPGSDTGYVVLRSRAAAIDFDSNGGTVTGTVALPVVPAWSYGTAVGPGGRIFMVQGNQILETSESNLGQATAHDIPFELRSLWGMRASSDGRFLYAVAQSPTAGGSPWASVFVAIDTTRFEVAARIPLVDIPHAWMPYEVPQEGKIYAVGGEPNGIVTVDVIDTTTHTLLKRITYDDPERPGIVCSSADPFAYDPESHTLFVGATEVILAIDTRTDTISSVIFLGDVVRALGLEPNRLIYINAVGLVYDPEGHYLYSSHLDGSFISVYDTVAGRFLPIVVPVKGLFPSLMWTNADVSRLYTLNDRSDDISVIATATMTVERLIDLRDHVPVPVPGAPFVGTQPASRTVQSGAAATFTSYGFNPRPGLGEPSEQWQVSTSGGATWEDIAGATTTTYSFTAGAADHNKQFRAVFTNAAGTSTTNAATLAVTKATPVISWANPAAITYGTALSGTQLNATASVAGSFVYTPPAGTVLNSGTHTLSVVFTPTDTANYTTATATVELMVLPAHGSAAPRDFDGDGRSELTVFRPMTGAWYVQAAAGREAAPNGYTWGTDLDVPVPGNYDGDGKTDVAVYRPGTGAWYILKSSTGFASSTGYTWGTGADIPVPEDYDGDGTTDLAVFRPSTGAWYVLKSTTGFSSSASYVWGAGTDAPVPADYDGDGKADVAVYRPSTGAWYIRRSSDSSTASYVWGTGNDRPVPGDYDGDGATDLAVWRPSTGAWYVRTSSSGFAASRSYVWGAATDWPVPGDYDGDGTTDVAVFRPDTGTWYVLTSGSGFTASQTHVWGTRLDVPPGAVRPGLGPTMQGDVDGDRLSELTVFRPATGVWYVPAHDVEAPEPKPNVSSSNLADGTPDTPTGRLPDLATIEANPEVAGLEGSLSARAFADAVVWGAAGDTPVPGDFDGDGRTDLVVWRATTGTWYVLRSRTGFTSGWAYVWGAAGDTPVPGDYDGDGITDLAVWRSTTGAWYVRTSSTGFAGGWSRVWGAAGDQAVPGDYDGDGSTDIAVWRPSTGVWYVLKSSLGFAGGGAMSLGPSRTAWGSAGDIPVPADYDGDGTTDVGVYRPQTGAWYILKSGANFAVTPTMIWGSGGDVPVPADYDGDGKADVAVWRPTTGVWYVLKSNTGCTRWCSVVWGGAGDIPLLRRQ